MTTMRKVIAYGQSWEFSTGKFNVVIKNPRTDMKFIIDYSKLTGLSWETLERGQNKKTSDGMITPDHVKAYIEKHLAIKPPTKTTKIAPTEKGPPSRTIIFQDWEESERGWGVRPDGFSLHIDRAHRDAYVENFAKAQHGDAPDDYVPDEYTRVSGSPITINVPAKIYKQLEAINGDFRGFDRKIGVDAAHNLVGLGPKGLVK